MHGAGSEDEGAARVAVEREVVGGGAGVVHRAAVLHVRHVVDGGLGEAKEAWRAEPVVEVLVPLVSEQPIEEHRALARLEPRDVGIAPEAELREFGRDDDRIVAPGIHGEDGARQRVLRLRPLGVEGARVPPGTRPHVGHRVDLGVGVGLLVGDHGAVRLLASVDAGLEVRPVIKRIDAETILTAPAPVNVLERSAADVSFLAAGPNPEWMTFGFAAPVPADPG